MVESNCIKFANNVKKYREQLGYNKSRMSELLDCDLSYIGKIERSEKFPNLKMIFKIAEVLQVSAKDLFDFERYTLLLCIFDKFIPNYSCCYI